MRPLFLLATLRRNEAHPTLGILLTELERSRRSSEIALGRLTTADVHGMARQLWREPGEPRPELLDSVAQLADGNPLYVEELLRSLADERSPLRIPRTLETAVAARLADLSEDARTALRMAAVAGRRFDAGLVGELLGIDDAGLTRLVKELVGAQLLVEDEADSFSFRHALTREVVQSTLLARERRAIHQDIAAILERRAAAPDAAPDRLGLTAALSHHFHEAGDWPKTAHWARHAGELALEVCTPRAAAAHFSRALEALGHTGDALEGAVYRLRAHAHEWQGDFELARADHQAALERARAARAERAEWRSLLDLAVLSREVDFVHVGDLLDQALTVARRLPDAAPLARTLSWVGFWQMMSERPHGA